MIACGRAREEADVLVRFDCTPQSQSSQPRVWKLANLGYPHGGLNKRDPKSEQEPTQVLYQLGGLESLRFPYSGEPTESKPYMNSTCNMLADGSVRTISKSIASESLSWQAIAGNISKDFNTTNISRLNKWCVSPRPTFPNKENANLRADGVGKRLAGELARAYGSHWERRTVSTWFRPAREPKANPAITR